MTNAPVSNIFHSSTHDGQGLRTVVFLAGCAMRCAWCHNPESLSAKRRVMLYPEKCIGCGECEGICDILSAYRSGGLDSFDACRGCGACESRCLGGAIRMTNACMSVDEVFSEVKKDKTYYKFSGGGVTVSGGECLLYPDFLEELFGRAREENIHTVIESAMNVKRESVERLIPLTDGFIVDIKLIDSSEHKKYTGVENDLILENIRLLHSRHPDVLVRTPLIPGVSDSEKNLFGIVDFLSSLDTRGEKKIELLRYNPLAKSKYDATRLAYSDFGERQSDEEMERIVKSLSKRAQNVTVIFQK